MKRQKNKPRRGSSLKMQIINFIPNNLPETPSVAREVLAKLRKVDHDALVRLDYSSYSFPIDKRATLLEGLLALICALHQQKEPTEYLTCTLRTSSDYPELEIQMRSSE